MIFRAGVDEITDFRFFWVFILDCVVGHSALEVAIVVENVFGVFGSLGRTDIFDEDRVDCKCFVKPPF